MPTQSETVTDSTFISSASTSHRITDPRVLSLLRLLWGLLVVYGLATCVLLLPSHLTSSNIYPSFRDYLAAINGTGFYLLSNLLVNISGLLFFLFLSTILMWRGQNERVAIIYSLLFVVMAPIGFAAARVGIGLLSRITNFTGWGAVLLGIYIFPDGHFSPRWLRFIFPIALFLFLFPISGDSPQVAVFSPQYLGGVLIGIGALIYRYRLASHMQRQQLKWLTLEIIFFGLWVLMAATFKTLPESSLKEFLNLMIDLSSDVLFLALPILLGFAILRYRLWDVDLIINRSLVYGAMTVLLVVLFAGIIALVSALTPSNGTILGVVIAAVASGALFNPARRAIQRLVDRRLYHLRYDQNELAAAQKHPETKNPGLYTGRIIDKYKVLDVLGRGGMGEVYKGQGDGDIVAIKVLPPDLGDQEAFQKRFQREIAALSTLKHPNIVKLFGSGVADGNVYYLIMEFIDGQHFGELIQHGHLSDNDELHTWVENIVAALEYIHGRGFVHRDLKPSNIMLRNASDKTLPQAVLMDFGLVRADDAQTRITGSGAVGTIGYMAPEQIMAAQEVDARADIYALGVLLYELLTGERPFKGSVGQVMFAHLQQPTPDPRDVNAEVPRETATAIMRAMAKKPEDRFQSAGDFARALWATP